MPSRCSFRDPAGYVAAVDGEVAYRCVEPPGQSDYNTLMDSGLYKRLVDDGLLLPHTQWEHTDPYVLEQPRVPFVSYPYEWCFEQLRAAALLTLKIAAVALDYGMVLKDASAFNVQFVGAKPVFIDTLSFTRYDEGSPWTAYGQFVRHFLAPLAVCVYRNVRLFGMFRSSLDGIPLHDASRLLPTRTWLCPSLLVHVHMHALLEARLAARHDYSLRPEGMPQVALAELFRSLRHAVERLRAKWGRSMWVDYAWSAAHFCGYTGNAKVLVIDEFLTQVGRFDVAWDIGANTGVFSRMASAKGYVVSFEADQECVSFSHEVTDKSTLGVLNLVMDLTNPSPALGWNGKERLSLGERGPADVVFCLAMIHHLALVGNIPLAMIAEWFAQITRRDLLVEWVGCEDASVVAMIEARSGNVHEYSKEVFEDVMRLKFDCVKRWPVSENRELAWWRRRNAWENVA